MTRTYSTRDAAIVATELGYTLGYREFQRKAQEGVLGTKVGPAYRFTYAQIVKFLKVTRRPRGHPLPKSVTADLDPESDDAKELFAMLEEMTNDD